MNTEELILEKPADAFENRIAGEASAMAAPDGGLGEVEKNWNEFGKRDPLWAILTVESMRNGQWDPDAFFATGETEIRGVLKYLEGTGHNFKRGKALDFGCGVGRLTQALADHFEECHGVDIAESMVQHARQFNRHGSRCVYHVNKQPSLALFAEDSFDFIYTNIVLQHNPPAMSRAFIKEFLRVLAPGGMLVFQLPSEAIQLHRGGGSPLDEGSFKAGITILNPTEALESGLGHSFFVSVKNLGLKSWPGLETAGRFPVRLGNHWRDALNRMVINDDARADLPMDVAPGQSVTLKLNVTTPGVPGKYRLELDMVQEHVAWFADKSSRTAVLEVEVFSRDLMAASGEFSQASRFSTASLSDGALANLTDPAVIVPRMEMNGIPKNEVLAFIAENGGKVVSLLDDSCATGWIGYRYHVTKGETVAEDVKKGTAPASSIETSPGEALVFKPHAVEWNDEKVSRFWDHMSSSVVGKEEYFSRQVGRGVTNFLAATCPEALAGKVLDFGCGPGYLLEPLAKVAGEIWGADSSPDSLAAAEARLRGKPNWRGAHATSGGKISLPEGGFDLITCVETIEHVVEQGLSPMLRELHKLLRRYHGLLLITTPFDERLEMSEAFCPDCGCAFHRWQHVRKFTRDSLSSLLEQHGYSTQLCTNLNFCDFQSPEFPAAGMPVSRSQVVDRLGKGPHLIWLGRAV